MARYCFYSETKDSNIEWVGEIPEHWEVKPLFGVASTESLKNTHGEETNVLSLSYGNIIQRNVDKNFGLLPASFNTYQLVNAGEIILRLTDLQNDKNSLRVGHSSQQGIITSAYLKLAAKENKLSGRYLYRLLHSYDTTKVFYGMGGGLRQSMAFDDMKRLPTITPPLEEQQQIADFLDYETAQIDTLIDKQQQLIQLLKEKRQAVISHAVTKGLNPDAPMKDSGIEWLGEVPEHWEVKRLKNVSNIIDCRNKTPEYFENGDYFVVRTTNIKNQRLNMEGALYTNEANFKIWTQRGIPPAGSIFFTREAPAGEICLVPDDLELCMGQRMMNVVCHDSHYIRYLFDFFLSDCLDRYIESVAHGSTVSHLRVEQVENIPVIVPPAIEIKAIHEELEVIKSKYLKLTSKAENAIYWLQERRSALISAAVTGKIDVRGWQPPAKSQPC